MNADNCPLQFTLRREVEIIHVTGGEELRETIDVPIEKNGFEARRQEAYVENKSFLDVSSVVGLRDVFSLKAEKTTVAHGFYNNKWYYH